MGVKPTHSCGGGNLNFAQQHTSSVTSILPVIVTQITTVLRTTTFREEKTLSFFLFLFLLSCNSFNRILIDSSKSPSPSSSAQQGPCDLSSFKTAAAFTFSSSNQLVSQVQFSLLLHCLPLSSFSGHCCAIGRPSSSPLLYYCTVLYFIVSALSPEQQQTTLNTYFYKHAASTFTLLLVLHLGQFNFRHCQWPEQTARTAAANSGDRRWHKQPVIVCAFLFSLSSVVSIVSAINSTSDSGRRRQQRRGESTC